MNSRLSLKQLRQMKHKGLSIGVTFFILLLILLTVISIQQQQIYTSTANQTSGTLTLTTVNSANLEKNAANKVNTINKDKSSKLVAVYKIGNVEQLVKANAIQIPIPGSKTLNFQKKQVINRLGPDKIATLWRGQNNQDSLSLVNYKGSVIGTIKTSTTSYTVRSLSSNYLSLSQADQTKLPATIDSPQNVKQKQPRSNSKNSPPSVISVLIPYSQTALRNYFLGDPNLVMAEAIYEIENTNNSFRNSGIYHNLQLLGVMESDVSESTEDGCHKTLHNLLINKAVQERRVAAKADIIMGFFSYPSNSCEFMGANANPFLGPINDATQAGYILVFVEFLGDSKTKVFAHEIGHVFGAGHEDGGGGYYSYSKGFSLRKFNTIHESIVASSKRFTDFYVVEDLYSNPKKIHLGVPWGVENERDNARTINETGQIVSTYGGLLGGNTPPPTNTPSPTSTPLPSPTPVLGCNAYCSDNKTCKDVNSWFYCKNEVWLWGDWSSSSDNLRDAGYAHGGDFTSFNSFIHPEGYTQQHAVRGGRVYARNNKNGWPMQGIRYIWDDATGNLSSIGASQGGVITGFSTVVQPNGTIVQHFVRGGEIYSRDNSSGWKDNWQKVTSNVASVGVERGGTITNFNLSYDIDGNLVQHLARGGRLYKRTRVVNNWSRWQDITSTFDNCSGCGSGGIIMLKELLKPHSHNILTQHLIRSNGKVFSRESILSDGFCRDSLNPDSKTCNWES